MAQLERRDALIMCGGGVKGLAFTGAMLELEKRFEFDQYWGTSAGAIAAVLFAAGFDAAALRDALEQKPFHQFLDGALLLAPLRLLGQGGLFCGDAFRSWLRDLLGRKLGSRHSYPLSCLPKRAVVFAAAHPYGQLIFDSRGKHQDHEIDFAVRCSMSIPFVFVPQYHGGRRAVDGGLLNNFPVEAFRGANPSGSYIGLLLDPKRRQWRGESLLLFELLSLLLSQDSPRLADLDPNVIKIDTTPTSTFDFLLSKVEKDNLVEQGRAAGLTVVDPARRKELENDFVLVRRRATKARRRTLSLLTLLLVASLAVATYGALKGAPSLERSAVNWLRWETRLDERLSTACMRGDRQSCGRYFVRLEQRCRGNDAEACAFAAGLRERGIGTERDEARAFAEFEKQCNLRDNPVPCYGLALMLRDSWFTRDVTNGRERAQAIFEELCRPCLNRNCTREGLRAKACSDAGVGYREGIYSARPDAKQFARRYYEAACRGESGQGCGNLARLLEQESPEDARALFEHACHDMHNPHACVGLGWVYERLGVLDRAADEYSRACLMQDAEGCCFSADVLLVRSANNPQYLREAAELYRRSCESTYWRACTSLAALYEDGQMGAGPSYSEAAYLYQTACETRGTSDPPFAPACRKLAALLTKEWSGKDPDRAAKYLTLAAMAEKGR
jgi:predicted acylesterase/phospholipase RssA/TPR repeat protein